MPNSLRCRIKKWCYQGIFSEKDRDRLIHGLDCADVFEQIWKDYNLVMNDEEDSIDVDFLIRFNETLDYIKKSKNSQILISLSEIEQIADELMNAAKEIDDRGDVFHEGFKSGFGLGVSSVVRKIKVGRNDSKGTNRTEPDDN